jgi:hypothetical protein
MVIGTGKKFSALHLPVAKECVLSGEQDYILRKNKCWIEPKQEILSIDSRFPATHGLDSYNNTNKHSAGFLS